MRVRLVVTGKAELLGLARSLQRLWPSHTFETVPMRRSPDGSVVPFDGFTSSRFPLPAGRAPANLDKLVEALAAEVCPGRRGAPADLAVLLDDLELENVDQPDVVLGCVRDAVHRHLSGLQGSLANRTAEALRARASFHLAVPMLETWFFGDPSALQAAGVPDHRLPARLRQGADPESFETDDSAFSLDDGTDRPGAHDRKGLAQRRVPPWLIRERADRPAVRRERHPKAYLQWLCRSSEDPRCHTYRESIGGVAALQSLQWGALLKVPEHFQRARDLIEDLEAELGPTVEARTSSSAVSQRARLASRSSRVLRNL